jgi:hypothetical protein
MRGFMVRAAILSATALLSACAQPSRPSSMVATATSQPSAPSVMEDAIAIGQVAGGEETNPMWTSEISAESFRTALQQSLINYRLHSPNGPYQLNAVLMNVDQPLIGLDMTVTTTVAYALVDRSEKEVWSRTVTAPYTATMSDAFLGVERLRIANEGSAKENIRRALDALVEEVDGADLLS